MAKQLLIYLFLMLPCASVAQTKKALQTYISNNLGYQTITYKSSGKIARITVFNVEFRDCTLNYKLQKEVGNKRERFIVRILLSRISKINSIKTKDGFYGITFTTEGKSILKEFPDGNLIHEKSQTLPLKAPNSKALAYLRKLKEDCKALDKP